MATKKNFGCFSKNLLALRCSLLCKNAAEFADKLGLDKKRLAEVEKGRLHPNEKEIDTIVKAFGYSFSQLCGIELKLKLSSN